MLLRDSCFGTILNIRDKVRKIWQSSILAWDQFVLVSVHEIELVRHMRTPDIGVFAQFDLALGALNEKPPVAPGRQPVRRKPVDANVPMPPT